MWPIPVGYAIQRNGSWATKKECTCLGLGVRVMPSPVAMMTRGAMRGKRGRGVTKVRAFSSSGCVVVVSIMGAAGCGGSATVGGDDLVEG